MSKVVILYDTKEDYMRVQSVIYDSDINKSADMIIDTIKRIPESCRCVAGLEQVFKKVQSRLDFTPYDFTAPTPNSFEQY